jgi:hypothetical protein
MLAVLLANTVIDYASESRHIPETGRWRFELYASYGAPMTIVVALVIGLRFVLHLDYAVRLHSAEIATRMAEQEIETAAMYTARDQNGGGDEQHGAHGENPSGGGRQGHESH